MAWPGGLPLRRGRKFVDKLYFTLPSFRDVQLPSFSRRGKTERK